MSIFIWEYFACLLDKMPEYLGKLFKATVVDCLKEGALFDPIGGRNTFLGKVILFQCLKKFTSGSGMRS